MTGSKIFAAESEEGASESGNGHVTSSNRTSVRIVQVFVGIIAIAIYFSLPREPLLVKQSP